MIKLTRLIRAFHNAGKAVATQVRPDRPKRRQSSRGRLALRRYFIISAGVALTALGVAITGSFLSVTYAEQSQSTAHPGDFFGSSVSQTSSALLDSLASRDEPLPPVEPVVEIHTLSAESAPPAAALVSGRINNVNLTFYDCKSQGFCGAMANGKKVYEGAAACSWNLNLGTKFRIIGDPTARVYVCADRGLLANTWVDIFWYDPADGWRWQASVGRYGTIEIIQ